MLFFSKVMFFSVSSIQENTEKQKGKGGKNLPKSEKRRRKNKGSLKFWQAKRTAQNNAAQFYKMILQ